MRRIVKGDMGRYLNIGVTFNQDDDNIVSSGRKKETTSSSQQEEIIIITNIYIKYVNSLLLYQ